MYGILVAMGIILAGTIIWLVTKFVKRKGEEHKLEQQQQQQQNRSGNQLVNGW
jgi:cell division protein FtsL